jgi:hypothetical protein
VFDLPPDQWLLLRRLLRTALDLPEPQRAPWIDALGPEDATLRGLLHRLVERAASAETAAVLATSPHMGRRAGAVAPARDRPGGQPAGRRGPAAARAGARGAGRSRRRAGRRRRCAGAGARGRRRRARGDALSC